MYKMNVLEKLERQEISVDKAISMLKRPPKSKPLTKGNILIIKIRDEDKKLFIPIPLFLINLTFLLAKFGVNIASKFADNPDIKEASATLKCIGYRDIRKLVNCLRICKSTGLVEVHDEDSMVIVDVV